MKEIKNERLTGERALFASTDLSVKNCIFEDGESPLKESKRISVEDSTFAWKYPLWYDEDVVVKNTKWEVTGRAGVWYTRRIAVKDCLVDGPKNFRRCEDLTLENVTFPHAEETLWACKGVKIKNVVAKGDYLAMNCSDMVVDGLELDGNYAFDGVKNVTVENSKLMTKDAFWNSENVTVKNCIISGEYLGWNSKNLTLIDCAIESLQGLCYIEGLKLVNCKLKGTNLAFEYCSDIDATVVDVVDSVKNPISGKIVAKGIGELILEADKIDPDKTVIVTESNDEV